MFKIILQPVTKSTIHTICSNEYQLFDRYQTIIHSDPSTSEEFLSFLLQSPLEVSKHINPGYISLCIECVCVCILFTHVILTNQRLMKLIQPSKHISVKSPILT